VEEVATLYFHPLLPLLAGVEATGITILVEMAVLAVVLVEEIAEPLQVV
jgi:hypothetical protein